MRPVLALLCALALCTPAVAAAEGDRAGVRYRVVEGVDGVPLNVVEAGDAARPGLLLVHGIGQSTQSFENQLHSSLAQEFHLVAYDLRGHGNSGKPWNREAYVDSTKWAGDLERVRVATGLERPVLVGWSYGTVVAADYLRHYGASGLAGIALIGAYGGLTPPPAPPASASAPTAPGSAPRAPSLRELQTSPNLEDNIAASHRVALLLTAKSMPPEWVERATLLGMLLPREAHAWMFERSLANQDLVPKITVPLLVFVGGRDVANTPLAGAEALVAKVPGAHLTVFPESGHSPFTENPERFNRELAAFARSAFTAAVH